MLCYIRQNKDNLFVDLALKESINWKNWLYKSKKKSKGKLYGNSSFSSICQKRNGDTITCTSAWYLGFRELKEHITEAGELWMLGKNTK